MIHDSIRRFEVKANLKTNFEPPIHMEKTFLNAAQLSEYLNLKPSTVYLKVATGDLPHYRIGRLIRFRREEIDAWMECHRNEKGVTKSGARPTLQLRNRSTVDINDVVEEIIEAAKGKRYIPITGKPDRKIKGLGKEVKNGSV